MPRGYLLASMSDPRLSALMIPSLGPLNKPQWRLLWGTLKGYFLIAPRPRSAYPTQSKTLKIILDIRYQDAIISPTSRYDSTRLCSPCPPARRFLQLPKQPPSLVSPLFPACSALFQRARVPMIPRPSSVPLFSYTCALFCPQQKLNSFIFMRFRALYAKHPGWGDDPTSHGGTLNPPRAGLPAAPFQLEKTLRNK